MKQYTQNGTYITIIHKYNKQNTKQKEYIIYKTKQKHTKHTTIYTMIQIRSKRIRKNEISQTVI